MQTTLTKIGNSSGIILKKSILNEMGATADSAINIEVKNGQVILTATKRRRPINTDVNTWDAQFKQAFKDGHKPEKSVWGNMQNAADKKEWI